MAHKTKQKKQRCKPIPYEIKLQKANDEYDYKLRRFVGAFELPLAEIERRIQAYTEQEGLVGALDSFSYVCTKDTKLEASSVVSEARKEKH